ncbi:hypothetical protein IF650_09315 [Cellulosimicrobium terreum]|nr:hypothetical protein [Cellulosimicrobium terreum]
MPRFRKLRRLAASRLPIATKDQVRAVAARSTRWSDAYERLLAAAEDRPARKRGPRDVPSPDPADKLRKAGKRPTTPLFDDLRRGQSFPAATVRTARTLLTEKRVASAQSFVDALVADPTTSTVGHLAAGVVAQKRGFDALAVHHFDESGIELAAEHAWYELVRSLFAVEPDRGVAFGRTALGGAADALEPRQWFELYKYLFDADELRLADQAFARLEERQDALGDGAWPTGRAEIEWDRKWVGAERNTTAPAPEAGRVVFGLIDYVQPGRARASQNIGDQVQTLASLGHVVRHQDLRFHGDQDVVTFVEDMQERVRPELRLDGVSADVELMTIDRDSTTYQAFPENTWLLEFGWHMHAVFGLDRYDFPMHPNLNPIFVSFHCNKRELLTPEGIEYLKAHGPIGCRDWTTVDLLLSLDVPAFFSGCLTTTVNTVFPDLETKPSPATVYVDVMRSPVPKGHENVRQSYPEVKKRTFTENMRDAVDLLERYRREYTDVVTTRLHCYLPTRSLGLAVNFEPKNNADVRFNGLFRLSQPDFDAIRTRMRDRLQPVLTAIFEGGSREDVYALWNELVADEVATARSRHARTEELEPHGTAAHDLALPFRPSAPADAEGAVDVVLTPTASEISRVAPVLRSAVAGTQAPVRAWVVARAARPAGLEVHGATVTWIDTTALDPAPLGLSDGRAVDRVLLPELLPVDRAVLLPVAAAVGGDVAELAATDLAGTALAARTASGASASGFAVLYGAARALDTEPDTAYEFYRMIHARHVFDFDAFDTGVMVLDLARLRDERVADELIPAMRTYRLDDRAALHLYAGAGRAVLDASWAHVPGREHVDAPRLWHWADSAKPWTADFVPGRDRWLAHQG